MIADDINTCEVGRSPQKILGAFVLKHAVKETTKFRPMSGATFQVSATYQLVQKVVAPPDIGMRVKTMPLVAKNQDKEDKHVFNRNRQNGPLKSSTYDIPRP